MGRPTRSAGWACFLSYGSPNADRFPAPARLYTLLRKAPLLSAWCLGNKARQWAFLSDQSASGIIIMNGIIYLVGLIVIIMFILSFLGLR